MSLCILCYNREEVSKSAVLSRCDTFVNFANVGYNGSLMTHIMNMKKTFCLAIAILAFAFIPRASASEQTFPAKHPAIKFVVPAKWTFEVDKTDGIISINSKDERVSVNFGEVVVAASMPNFNKMLPAMLKLFKEPTVAEKAREYFKDGLSGFTATYLATLDDKPAKVIFLLLKAGSDRAIIGNVIVLDTATLPKEDDEAIGHFMKSLKSTAQK